MKKSALSIMLSAAFCLAWLAIAVIAAAITDVIVITDRAGLESIAQNPSGCYALAADLDMGDEPWTPIPFSGRFDGAGHALLNLTIRDYDPVTAVSVDGNAKQYDTVFAALFSRTHGAVIENLTLLGVDVDISAAQNVFASGLVGYAEDTQVTNCTVTGRVKLEMTDRMCGVAGIMGFGYGNVADCAVDVTLILVDGNREIKCEEFMGGVLATGYADISGCGVRLRAYTSVYGYVHNGGIAGMYYVHTSDTGYQGYVKSNTVDAEIYFFEANNDRRAYCEPYVGERLNRSLEISENTYTNYVNGETFDYSAILSPEKCATSSYTERITPPGCTNFGFTTYACAACGYSFDAAYTLPAHTSGEWEVLRAPAADSVGLRRLLCAVCGELLDEEEFTLPTPAETDNHTEPLNAAETLPEPSLVPGEETPASFPAKKVIIYTAVILALAFIIALTSSLNKRGRHESVRRKKP